MKDLVESLFRNVPSGVGSHRKDLRLEAKELREVLLKGASWAISQGFGLGADLDAIEAGGRIGGADPEEVSDRAVERGRNQLGTLGSGNHFVEIGYVADIYDEKAARALRLEQDAITVIIHTGSRGLGYQVCDDFIAAMLRAADKYGILLPDRQLCCAPLVSEEGERYLRAMSAAANFAFANRQVITAFVRRTFEEVLGLSPREAGLSVVYDVCHNIAKMEEHEVDGRKRRLCVHRKGATRAFPPGHPETPAAYRAVGQPVLIPGDMGRYSYVLVGTERAYKETFGSTCHGAGRVLMQYSLPDGTVDDGDGRHQLLGGRLRILGFDQGPELLDLGPQRSLAGFVHRPAALVLANVLDRALGIGQILLPVSLRFD